MTIIHGEGAHRLSKRRRGKYNIKSMRSSSHSKTSRLVQIDRATSSALLTCLRGVVQANSNSSGGVFQASKNREQASTLRRNKSGNYYRMRQKMWPSVEALEIQMTHEHHDVGETIPFQLLPRPAAFSAAQRLASPSQLGKLPLSSAVAEAEPDEPRIDAPLETETTEVAVSEKLVTWRDILPSEGTAALSSSSSSVESGHSAATRAEERRNARSAVSWHLLPVLDPVVQQVAHQALGPSPTRVQVRLLSALLDPDHNDVLLNGARGRGKTSALLLAMLQAIRQEDSGFNVLVCSTAMEAKRCHDTLSRYSRQIQTIEAEQSNDSWSSGGSVDSLVLLAPFREAVDEYEKILRPLTIPEVTCRPRAMICTADVFCELMFAHKLQFEQLGYLRRVFVDDAAQQFQMLKPDDSHDLVRNRLRDPVAVELLLGTLHQLPGPYIRSILQLGIVSANMDQRLRLHALALCIKQDAHKVLANEDTIDSSIHCVFSFCNLRNPPLHSAGLRAATLPSWLVNTPAALPVYLHVVTLLRNASRIIPGRCVILVSDGHDVTVVRRLLRSCGMDAKIAAEVFDGCTEICASWKFLVVRPFEAEALPLTHVSHVVVSYPPRSEKDLLHAAKLVSCRNGNSVGWLYTVCPLEHAVDVSGIASSLGIDLSSSCVTESLETVPASKMQSIVKPLSPYAMEPQYVVRQHYENLAEHVGLVGNKREFFSKPYDKQFYVEDYTPLPELQLRANNAMELRDVVDANPATVAMLQRNGYLDAALRPTTKMRAALRHRTKR